MVDQDVADVFERWEGVGIEAGVIKGDGAVAELGESMSSAAAAHPGVDALGPDGRGEDLDQPA